MKFKRSEIESVIESGETPHSYHLTNTKNRMKVGGIYKDTAAILYECVYVEKDQVVLKTKHDDKLFVVFPNFYSTFEEVKPIHKRWLILRDKGNISIVCDSLEELKGHIHRLDESEILSVVELHVQEGIFDIALDEI